MMDTNAAVPEHYAATVRTLLRFAIVMAFVGFLSGILYQESSKQLDLATAGDGLHLEATIHLALVHGHVFVTAVLVPVVMAGALFLARGAGGVVIGRGSLRWLTGGYLPLVTLTIALMLCKGYHFLLAVRRGETDLEVIDATFLGGMVPLRHGIYGFAHVGMALTMCVFLVLLWRSLKRQA